MAVRIRMRSHASPHRSRDAASSPCARISPARRSTFPPRNEPFAFPAGTERIYRDELRRGRRADLRGRGRRHRLDAGVSAVSPEWLRAFRRQRSHAIAGDRRAGAAGVHGRRHLTPPPASDRRYRVCDGRVRARRLDDRSSTARDQTPAQDRRYAVRQHDRRQSRSTASSPIDRIIVSVNTTGGSSSSRLTPSAVVGSYYEVRLSSPQTVVTLNVQGAGSFNLEFAGSLGSGPARSISAAAIFRGPQSHRHVGGHLRQRVRRQPASSFQLNQTGTPRHRDGLQPPTSLARLELNRRHD